MYTLGSFIIKTQKKLFVTYRNVLIPIYIKTRHVIPTSTIVPRMIVPRFIWAKASCIISLLWSIRCFIDVATVVTVPLIVVLTVGIAALIILFGSILRACVKVRWKNKVNVNDKYKSSVNIILWDGTAINLITNRKQNQKER